MSCSHEPTPPRFLLRPHDHAPIAVLLASALVLLGVVWWRHGGQRGQIVDIDRAPPLVAQFQVDVNRAEWPELIQLPGIGRTLADRLVAERDANGAFRDVEDLGRVGGIGPRTLERIRPYILPIPDEREIAGR